MPLAEADGLLRHKSVPVHDHYIWYYLGGVLLIALACQLVTGCLLVVHYEASVPGDAGAAGAHESLRAIVNDLPHGWWIRSLHHWGAHAMIMAAFIHMFSVLLLKAYRRPRELLWWTGLALLALILAAGFTGYLLPWNSLSFAATRVGGGIAGATPLAGPLIRNILLGGSDVSAATLTRFFGLHVAVLPMLIVGLAAVHVGLMGYHGSSVPPSVRHGERADEPIPALRFWPEFMLRDLRVWLLAITGLLVVAYLVPPSVGERADMMAPTPKGILPEWYFLAMFKILKLLPSHVGGLENLQAGVLGFSAIGLVLIAIPLLWVVPGQTGRQRRRRNLQRRCLLGVSFLLGWAATAPPVHLTLLAHWPGWGGTSASTAAGIGFVVVALGWLVSVVIIDRAVDRSPNGPATLFGVTLISAWVGYTLWVAEGARITLCGLAVLWTVMAIIRAARSPRPGSTSTPAVIMSTLLLLLALLATIPLGRVHEKPPADEKPPVAAAVKTPPPAPVHRKRETASRLGVMLLTSAFLLVVIQRRISHQSRLRRMGLMQ